MTRDELETRYRRYIDCLNERRHDDAEAFYCEELLYNEKHISSAEWRKKAIEDSLPPCPTSNGTYSPL